MTLAQRNIMMAGIILGFLVTVFIGIASPLLIPLYASIDAETIRRPAHYANRGAAHYENRGAAHYENRSAAHYENRGAAHYASRSTAHYENRSAEGIFHYIVESRLRPDLLAVHISIAALAVFSHTALILIYVYLKKNESPELLFIAIFVLSLSFEAVRLVIALQQLIDIPSVYLLIVSRILLISRNFGIFSLFAASLYAAGLKNQKPRNITAIIAITSLIIALGIPVDTFSWTSNFEPGSGYASLSRILNTGILFITVASFLIAAWTQRSKNYVYISIGALLILAGRNITLAADTWPGLTGIALLAAGTWILRRYFHSAQRRYGNAAELPKL